MQRLLVKSSVRLFIILFILGLAPILPASAATPQFVITTVKAGGLVDAQAVSMRLDAHGNPVISYYESNSMDLKLVHCNDSHCTGSDNFFVTVDSTGDVGESNSLVLDAAGNPVISYTNWDEANRRYSLKLVHCNDPNCASGGNSIVTVDRKGSVGFSNSLTLDAAGNPVISYSGYSDQGVVLRLAHCNDPNCAAGGDSIVTVAGGSDSSLALDAVGNPVISYVVSRTYLNLVHCDDPNCVPGGDSIVTLDSSEGFIAATSLALDAAGSPAVSYVNVSDLVSWNLKLARCNDPYCIGGEDSVSTLDYVGYLGGINSLALDSAGNPVISYEAVTETDCCSAGLKLAHCDDPSCASGGDSIIFVDFENEGGSSSLALDVAGNPVIAYSGGISSYGDGDLKLAHCADSNCALGDNHINLLATSRVYGQGISLVLDSAGYPVISHRVGYSGALLLTHCNDPVCANGGEVENRLDPEISLDDGYTSLALDASGNPVITYHAHTNDLKLAHCDDPNCAPGGDSIVTIASALEYGGDSVLVLDGYGNPVIAYTDYPDGNSLRLVHCDDPDCVSGGDSTAIVESDASGREFSFVLDAVGNPVISYIVRDDDYNLLLKLVHCDDPNCISGGHSVVTLDDSEIKYSIISVALDLNGNPVVSYLRRSGLSLIHCNDPNCAPGGDSIVIVDSSGSYWDSSLALGPDGNPILSYYDLSKRNLRLARCDDPNCAPGGNSIFTIDSVTIDINSTRGRAASLAMDAGGHPVISYHDDRAESLKLAREVIPAKLTVRGSGGGAGTISAAGITCAWNGSKTSGDCTETLASGTSVKVVAAANSGSVFGGWTGCTSTSTTTVVDDTCHITLSADTAITAAFTASQSLRVDPRDNPGGAYIFDLWSLVVGWMFA